MWYSFFLVVATLLFLLVAFFAGAYVFAWGLMSKPEEKMTKSEEKMPILMEKPKFPRVFRFKKKEPEKKPKEKPKLPKEIVRMNKVLSNIERYDGSSIGQEDID